MPVVDRSPRRKKEETTPASRLITQLDTLESLSANFREDLFGSNWFEDIREFYNLTLNSSLYPSFRPPVAIPQFQTLAITEGSDLADMNPKIYITKGSSRVKERETALQSEWRDAYVNNQLMLAAIWSMLNGNGYIQVGFDPYARGGLGRAWVRMRDPETVFPDPAATSEQDWNYLQIVDRVYPEVVHERFPITSRSIAAPPPTILQPSDEYQQRRARLRVLPGPMSVRNPIQEKPQMSSDGRVRLRYTWLFDGQTVDVVQEKAGTSVPTDELIDSAARFKLKYPNGRLVVDCEGSILYDGDNNLPSRSFGLVRIMGLPALNSFYAPPPLRFTRTLQTIAEKLYTQFYENVVRCNNGIWFIEDACGISADDFGGIPGEVRVINTGSKVPEFRSPQALPAQVLEIPKTLLALQRELMGFTPPRQGESGKGNIGVDLFDAAVFQSQSMTRMRAKLMAESVYRIAQQLFALMATYYKDYEYPDFSKEFEMKKWERIANPEEFMLYLDPASVRPISQAAMQKMIPVLRKEGLLDARTALEELDIPGSGEIAEHLEKEQALQAIARLRRR